MTRTAVLALFLVAVASPAVAQTTHRFTIAVGATHFEGYGLGDQTAVLRRNAPTPTPFPFFRVETRLDPVNGPFGRIGFGLTRDVTVEGGASYLEPRLAVLIADDPEFDGGPLEGQPITQLTVDVGAVWRIPWLSVGQRFRPHVTVSGAYLRQLHADRTLVETGRLVQYGGGFHLWVAGSESTSRAVGLRAEALRSTRTRGIDFEDQSRAFPVINVMGALSCRRVLCF